MDSHELGRKLLDGPRLDVRLSHFSPVAAVRRRPLYDSSAPYGTRPQPAGEYLELLPDGLPEGTGC